MAPNTSFTRNDALPTDATLDTASLSGKSVVITGGASGIGEATLRALVKVGAFVTFGDLAEDLGNAIVDELGADKVAFVRCDVLSWDEQVKLFKTALEKSPAKTIDVVIANAGMNAPDEIFLQKEDENGDPLEPSTKVIQTNLIGVAYTAKLALFYFPKQPENESRDRCLLMTASFSAYLDHPGSPQYNSAKWGVRGLMHSLRLSGPAKGIRVNMIAPWFIGTRIMSKEVQDKVTASGIQWANVEDAAGAFVHLASNNNLNGRALGIVPRTMHPRGYYDLEADDLNEDNPISKFQNMAIQVGLGMAAERARAAQSAGQ